MNLGIIIQARMGSTRLPNKVLRPFYREESILAILIKKLQRLDFPIHVATSTARANDAVEELADKLGVACFRGDEQNVLSRFLAIGEVENYTHIVRVCADNPFLSVGLVQQLYENLEAETDYLSFRYQDTPVILTHFGVFAEIVRVAALKKVIDDLFYQEHVTNYIYQHPAAFQLNWMPVDESLFFSDGIRLTVDTLEDFELAQQIYADLAAEHKDFDLVELFQYLKTKPILLQQMQAAIQYNQK